MPPEQGCGVVVALPRLLLRLRFRPLFFIIITCPVGSDSDSVSHYKSCIVTTTPGDSDSDSITLATKVCCTVNTLLFHGISFGRRWWNLPNILAYISVIFDDFFRAGLVPLTYVIQTTFCKSFVRVAFMGTHRKEGGGVSRICSRPGARY